MRTAPPTTSRWIMRYHPLPQSPVRLVCFPHAGGSASYYRPLSVRFGGEADVVCLQYPGRQDRRLEPCIEDLGEMADRIAAELSALEPRPSVFFGHSMGAVLAFETAWRLERTPAGGPRSIVVSGRRAPSARRAEDVHHRADDGIIAELKRLGGTDMALMDDELLRMAMPSIRADYRAVESYVAEPGRTIAAPIVAATGDADPLTTLAEADRWREHTTAAFRRVVLHGGHFFITTNQPAVQAEIARELAAAAR
jgi:surfactin synthase thioesterase subunit